MLTDEEARQLHDRASRAEDLTPPEQVALEEWYVRQDSAEGATLTRAAPSGSPDMLQERVAAAARRLHVVSGKIEVLTAENQKLRQEIAALQRQLASKTIASLP